MKAILAIYLVTYLRFSESRATTLFHGFNSAAYAFSILGGILSDSFLGKYKTIVYLSSVYCIGSLTLAFSSIPPSEAVRRGTEAPPWIYTVGALFLIALGTGGIKPCVSSFGGDQFEPSQVEQIALFFSIFYFSINAGSVLSTLLTPILRADFKCFGQEGCYPLAFAVPSALMLVAVLVFISGSGMYKRKGRILNAVGILDVFKVIYSAMKNNIKYRLFMTPPIDAHWDLSRFINYARLDGHDVALVEQVGSLSFLLIFIPVSAFWALYDQQASAWVFQASKMSGDLWAGYSIKPEQLQLINSVLILVLIPSFQKIVYPGLARIGLKLAPLVRIGSGLFFVGVAFIMAAVLQWLIERSDPVKIHMLWQFPQYFVITCAEILLSITGLQFAYSQAPPAMTSFCTAMWLLTVAAGNILVIFVTSTNLPGWWMPSSARGKHEQAWAFLVWSFIAFISLICFVWLSFGYKYVNEPEEPHHEVISNGSMPSVEYLEPKKEVQEIEK